MSDYKACFCGMLVPINHTGGGRFCFAEGFLPPFFMTGGKVK